MFIPVGSGPSQSDNINRMIQLTVIQLSGGHCIVIIIKSASRKQNLTINQRWKF
jgi:hypothetical protein